MKNKLREILRSNKSSIATRIASAWGIITEIAGKTGQYDYVEYLAEYSPLTVLDFENLARACELHGMGSIVKIDFQNRAFVAQKALAAGMQGILFTDCKTADDVRDCVYVTSPDLPDGSGRFGYPNYRWIGYDPSAPQMEYAQNVRDVVRFFMIEKKDAVDNIEEICRVPGVDIVQFGPSDFSLSCGVNMRDNLDECKRAERHCIEVALKNGVQPRCEIHAAEDAQYYMNLGVQHFCLGDELKILGSYWRTEGEKLRGIV